MKTCTVCGNTKEKTEFYRMSNAKDGLLPRCKDCQDHYHRDKRAKARAIREQAKAVALKCGEKTCTKCGLSKKFSEFHPQKDGWGGVRGDCKECVNAKNLEWQRANVKLKRARDKEYRKRPSSVLRKKKYEAVYRPKYYAKNKEKILAKTKALHVKRLATDKNYLLLSRLRSRLREVTCKVGNFREYRNGRKSLLRQCLGCTPSELRQHIESQFIEGMTWENYGLHGWHIDHIKPCAHYDLSDIEQVKKCFHYTNLQPKWAKENWSKGARFVG